MYQDFFTLLNLVLKWLTNPGCTNLLLVGLAFGIGFRFLKWF